MKKAKKKNRIKNSYFNKGFTLIELMVSTSIFMVIMLAAIGSLLVTSNLAKKSYALNFTMDNLSFAVESMSRSLRMGTNYTCGSTNSVPQDCSNGASVITFTPAGKGVSERMSYRLITRGDGTQGIQRSYVNGNPAENMISSNINVKVLKFFVKGSSSSDLIQPSVFMLLRGSVLIKGKATSFAIQTLISQRTAEQ